MNAILRQCSARHRKERLDLLTRQRAEKRLQAQHRRTGQDRKLFEAVREAQRKKELDEQKRDIAKPPERKPDNNLSAKFRAAKDRTEAQEKSVQRQGKGGGLSEKVQSGAR